MNYDLQTSLIYQLDKCCNKPPYLDIRIDYGNTLLLEAYCFVCTRKANVSHKFEYPGSKLDLFQIHQFRVWLMKEWNKKKPTGLPTEIVDKSE